MISKENFKKYVTELTCDDKENLIKQSSSSSGASTGVGIVFLVIGFITFFSGIGIVFFLIGMIFLASSTIISSKNAAKKRDYRNKYINKLLDCLLEGYDYKFDSEAKIDKDVFDKSQFVSGYDIYNGSDKLSINIPNDDGSVSSTYLTLCDLDVKRIEYRHVDNSFGVGSRRVGGISHTRRKRVEVSLYKGVFGYVDFPFEFKCVLGLNQKYRKSGVNLEVVKLEGMEFHKKFGVYCNNQIEARYILTPEMMEKLLDFYNIYKGIRIVLVDNKMYFSFPSKNLLELRNYKGDNFTMFEGIYDDVNNILSVVEEIKNNNKIFRM